MQPYSARTRIVPNLLLLLFILCCLWGCAAEGSPPGGPVDEEGPRIVGVEPPSGFTQMAPRQEIEITFNEPVDPVSVPGSIIMNPESEITTRVRGRRIIIRPQEPYRSGVAYTVTFKRGIRDYQRNSIPRSYQVVFSTGGQIPDGVISGRVSQFNAEIPMTVGLFRKPDTSRSYQQVRSIDLASDGSFSFDYLSDGAYRIVAVDGELNNFPDLLYRQSYALLTVDSIYIQSDSATVRLRRSPPLSQPQIRSLDWLTPNFLSITFDGPFGEVPLPENLFRTKDAASYNYLIQEGMKSTDSTVIDLGAVFNQLGEQYNLRPVTIPTAELIDTIPPAITVAQNTLQLIPSAPGAGEDIGAAEGRLTFSEPIRVPEVFSGRLIGQDTTDITLLQVDPLTLRCQVAKPEQYGKMTFVGFSVQDEAGNAMADSLIVLKLAYSPPSATGRVRGSISGFTGLAVVEAISSTTGKRIAYTLTDSVRFYIDKVPPGFYTVFAHEYVGKHPLPYYSGRWEPYHRAARFAYYDSVIEVRPRWEVDGIDINFNAGIFGIPQP